MSGTAFQKRHAATHGHTTSYTLHEGRLYSRCSQTATLVHYAKTVVLSLVEAPVNEAPPVEQPDLYRL
jgi:hypothetical protein